MLNISVRLGAVLWIRDVLSWIRIRPFSHSGSKHFFIPDPTGKVECKLTFFVLIYLHEQCLSLSHRQKDPGSQVRKKLIPDLGGKK
jgi:hypothetical protein